MMEIGIDFSLVTGFLEMFATVDVFIAVFVRVLGFFLVLPVMSGQNLPLPARIGLSLGIALLAFTADIVVLPDYQFTAMGFGFLIIQEIMIGILLGFVVMLLFSMFHFVGQLVDFQIGFMIASVADPFSQQQMPITGNFYYLLISLFFVGSGALHAVIAAFFGSYTVIAMGEAVILGNASLAYFIVDIIVQYFRLGVQIAMPVIGTMMIVNIALGILVKAVPQMNVFVVGLPMKVFLGSIVIFLTLPFLNNVFSDLMYTIIEHIHSVLWGMRGT